MSWLRPPILVAAATGGGSGTGSDADSNSYVTDAFTLNANAKYVAFVLNARAGGADLPTSLTSSSIDWTYLADEPYADYPGTATRRLSAYEGAVTVAGGGSGTSANGLKHPWSGTWVIHQVNPTARTEFNTIAQVTANVNTFLDMPGVVGFSPRLAWDEIETSAGVYDTTFLDTCRALATAKGKLFIPRIMAGKYSPAYVKSGGGTFTDSQGTGPNPFTGDGVANSTFENAYAALLDALVAWASGKSNVVGIHNSWFSLNYSELYYGPGPQAIGPAANNKANFVAACKRLIDIAYTRSTATFPMAFGLSGHGPINGVAGPLAQYMRDKTQQDFGPRLLMNANGWGPNGEWGGGLEATLDAEVWPKPVLRGLQDIFPNTNNGGPRSATAWDAMFDSLEALGSTWAEIYSPGAAVGSYQDSTTAIDRMKARIASFYETQKSGTGTPSANDTITVTFPNTQAGCYVAVAAVTGTDLATPITNITQRHADVAAQSASLDVTVDADSVVLAGFGRNTSATGTPNGSAVQTVTGAAPVVGLDVQTTTGGNDPTLTWSGSAKWAGIALELATATTVPPDPEPIRLGSPYIPLGTQMDNGSGTTAAQLNGLTDLELEELCRYYMHFHDEGSGAMSMGLNTLQSGRTLASRLASLGAVVSKYRNGSYCTQGTTFGNEGALAEQDSPAHTTIAWWYPGNYGGPRDDTADTIRRHKVRTAVNASATTLQVWVRHTDGLTNVPTNLSAKSLASSSPPFSANTWPYFVSKGTGTTSPNTAGAKCFVRVDNEVMRVTAMSLAGNQNYVTLTVARGALGTTAASHSADAKVLSPVYIGAETADPPDANLAGNPSVNSSVPVRYALRIWTDKGADFIADRIEDTYGLTSTPRWEGLNAFWLDIGGVTPYNTGDPWQNPVTIWKDDTAAKMTSTTWTAAQVSKLTRFGARGWTDTDGQPIKLFSNGMATNRSVWVSGGIPAVSDAGIFEKHPEAYNANGNMDTATSAFIADLFDVFVNDREAILWARPERSPAWQNRTSGMRWAYCLILQAYRTTANKWHLMSKFDLDPGLVSGGAPAKPDYCFFWNLGTPVGTPTALSDNLVSGSLYKREFANGIALVNMGSTAATFDLPPGNWYDTTNASEAVDPTAIVGSISVPARDGRIILRQTAVGGQQKNIVAQPFTNTTTFGTGSLMGAGITGGFVNTTTFGFGSLALIPNKDIAGVGFTNTTTFGTGTLEKGFSEDPGPEPEDPGGANRRRTRTFGQEERLGRIIRRA